MFELNRLVRTENFEGQLSEFVAKCLRELKKDNWIVVSYSDTGMNHHGYIYQSCNFYYTGMTKQRTDKWVSDNKHSRHSNSGNKDGIRQVRTAKHRYIYFCADKRTKKDMLRSLNYEIMPYPKGDNSNYELGDIYYPVTIDKHGNVINKDGIKQMQITNKQPK